MYSPKNTAKHFSEDHDYILVYAKNSELWRPLLLPRTPEMESRYKNPDKDPRGKWKPGDLSARNFYSQGTYSITCPSGKIIEHPPSGTYWRVSKQKFKLLDDDNRIWWGADGNNTPSIKRFLSEVKGGRVPQTLWLYKEVGHTQEAKKELLRLLSFDSSDSVFETPKPTRLIIQMLKLLTQPYEEDIVLDFFSGSASTADAVIKLNAEDSGNRKFILIQLPEPTNSDDFSTISEIGKERIRKAGEKILEENKDKEDIENLDTGFKVFRVADTNINWLREDLRGGDLFDHYDKNASDKDKLDFTPGFTDIDVVYEIMLRQTDIPLSSRVEQLTAMGQRTYLFADSFLVCLETTITRELVERLAAIEPLPIKFIFRDSAFDDDIALKDETFRTLSALTDRNSGGEKHTYTVEFI
jgi:adenine-specific DNA-methyltransferase